MARTPNKPPSPPLDDQDLWQHYCQTVKPLDPTAKSKQGSIEPKKKIPLIEKKEIEFKFSLSHPLQTLSPLATDQEQQLDSHWRRRLDQGKMPIEAMIDLHGLTQKQAHQALLHFIEQSINKKRRLILVITGKGRDGKSGVIKQNFLSWLDQSNHRAAILSIIQAKKHHGGGGAFYILLRRKILDNIQSR